MASNHDGDITPDLGAGGVLDFRIRQLGADAFEDCDGSRRVAEDHPRTLRGLHRVGQWADHGYVLQALGKRQEPAFVPQQHHRALGGEPRFLAVLGQCDNLLPASTRRRRAARRVPCGP